LSETTGTSKGTGFYGQMKQKKGPEQKKTKTKDVFGANRDKKVWLNTLLDL